MYASRQFGSRLVACRSAPRSFARQIPRQQCRHQSTSTLSVGSFNKAHVTAGVVGGVVALVGTYVVWSFTPAGRAASKLNKAAVEASKTYEAAVKKLQSSKPNADQAVSSIKQFAYSYAAWVPGGKSYVDAVFKDWDAIRESHQQEADKIVNDAYNQLKEISKSGLSMQTAARAYDVLSEVSKKIASLGSEAISDIIDNHPAAKEKFGPGIEKLQSMANNYGPEVKKQVDQTWGQVKDILSGGLSASNLDKARKLIEEKVQEISKLSDDAWNKGLEAAKPYLDKNPKIKELIEKNAESLKQANITELFQKVRSGDVDDLQKYVQDTVEKGKKMASGASDSLGLDKYLKMVPQGGDVLQKLQQIGQLAEKHKDEGEKLFKETVEEIKKILEKQSEKGKDIVEKAKKETK
ncbi:hypothetical protein E4U55_004858 [Claviceps digitariae]|nr:hypothetical protein E4U55_004858 [Claviceps digitariae]